MPIIELCVFIPKAGTQETSRFAHALGCKQGLPPSLKATYDFFLSYVIKSIIFSHGANQDFTLSSLSSL